MPGKTHHCALACKTKKVAKLLCVQQAEHDSLLTPLGQHLPARVLSAFPLGTALICSALIPGAQENHDAGDAGPEALRSSSSAALKFLIQVEKPGFMNHYNRT